MRIRCPLCSGEYVRLRNHVTLTHQMAWEDFSHRFPELPAWVPGERRKIAQARKQVSQNPEYREARRQQLAHQRRSPEFVEAARSASTRNVQKLNKEYWEQPANKARKRSTQRATLKRQLKADPDFRQKARAAQSLEVNQRRGSITATTYLNPVYWAKPENKRRAARRMQRLNLDGQMGQQSPNLLESDIAARLPKSIRFVGDGQWWRKHPDGAAMNPDFKVTGKNRVIEIFGDYWHRDDDPQVRIQRWADCGVQCLVVWESSFRKRPAKTLIRIGIFARA